MCVCVPLRIYDVQKGRRSVGKSLRGLILGSSGAPLTEPCHWLTPARINTAPAPFDWTVERKRKTRQRLPFCNDYAQQQRIRQRRSHARHSITHLFIMFIFFFNCVCWPYSVSKKQRDPLALSLEIDPRRLPLFLVLPPARYDRRNDVCTTLSCKKKEEEAKSRRSLNFLHKGAARRRASNTNLS